MDKSLLMEKVIAGNASSEEQKEFDTWISESEDNLREFNDVKWLTENADHTQHDPDDPFYDGLKRIQSRMKTIQKRRRIMRIVKTVAGVIVIIAVLYLLFHQLGLWTSSGRDWNVDLHNSSYSLADRFTLHAPHSQI